MKKSTITWLIIAAVVVIGFLSLKGMFNNMVSKDESVKTAWSQVENQYQRRYDLIPNLVKTVEGAKNFEKDTLIAVTEARAKVGQMNVDVKNAEQFAQFQNAQEGLSSALSRLMVVVEKYPELTATQSFRDLQAELAGTENRIATERMRFNEAAKNYNIYIRNFPNNLFAGMFGFQAASLFEAVAGAETAPKIDFSETTK